MRDFREFPHQYLAVPQGPGRGNQESDADRALWQTIADIIELQVKRRYTRPMAPAEVEEQVRQNRRSVHADDKLLKLLESRDANGAEKYWTTHLAAVGDGLLGPDADALIDLPD